jgi:flagellar protein FliO/FliZ
MMKHLSSIVGMLTCTGLAQAADPVNLKGSSGVPGLAEVVTWSLSLMGVLGLFFVCVWLLRKSGQLSTSGKPSLNVAAGLSLGMREKIVLLNVGEKQLLLGVTPGRIDKLLELEGEQRLMPDLSRPKSDFSAKLVQAMQGKSGA